MAIKGIQRFSKWILEQEAKRAEKNEILIGINPKSYLGQEILKQSREIIALRSVISDLTVEINKLKKEVHDINRAPDK